MGVQRLLVQVYGISYHTMRPAYHPQAHQTDLAQLYGAIPIAWYPSGMGWRLL
jgi:hypothetical protein